MAAPSLGKQVGRGAIWSVVNSALVQVINLLVFLVTARFVPVADFGILATCLLFVELFKQISVESFATAIVSRGAPDAGDYNACFLLIQIGAVIGAALMLLSAQFISEIMHNERIEFALRLTSVLLLSSGLSRTHEAWMTRQLLFKPLAIRSILALLVGGGAGLFLAMNGWGLTALVVQQLTTSLLSTILLWVVSDWRPSLRVERAKLLATWRYGRHVAITGFTNFANTQSDTFFSSYYLGASATGIYNAAKRILLGLNQLMASALSRVALPTFAGLRDDEERLRGAFLNAVSFTTAITAPMFLSLIAVSDLVVRVALGAKWMEAAPIISIIAGTAYLTTIGQYNQAIILVKDKPHWQTVLTSIYAVSNISLFLVVVRYGLQALAVGFTVRAVLLYPLSVGAALHLLRIKPMAYAARIAPSLAASAVMVGALLLLHRTIDVPSPLLALVIHVAVGAVVYAAALFVIGRREMLALIRFARSAVARG